MEEISELLILKQFFRMVNPEMEVCIQDHNPESAEEAACLTEVFLSARNGSRRPAFGRGRSPTRHSKSYGGE